MKLRSAAAVVSAFVLFLSAALCCLMGLKVKNAADDGLYIISMRRAGTFFHPEDLALLEGENLCFTFTESLYMETSSGTAKDEAEVVGTNENFARMARLRMISGSFFNEMHVKKRSRVVVISAAAAWRFFGDGRSTGNMLYFGNEAYGVIGVFDNAPAHKDKLLLYLPFESLDRHVSDNPAISDIWLSLRDISQAGLITAMLGRPPEEVRILRMEQYKSIVLQRFRSIVFIAGASTVVFLWKRLRRSAGLLWREAAAFLRVNYASELGVLVKRKSILFRLLTSISHLLAILIILKLIRFKAVIPPGELTSAPFDFTVVSGILDFYLQPNIGVQALEYLNGLNSASHVFFFISVLSGLVFAHCIRGRTSGTAPQ